jgi:hypothetical protein
MRRQLLEYQRSLRGGAVTRPTPSLRDMSAPSAGTSPADTMPVGTMPLDTLPLGTVPLGTVPLGTTRLEPTSPGTPPLGITPIAAPTAPSLGDSRLTDRERNLLRQQLRQLPRIQPPTGN